VTVIAHHTLVAALPFVVPMIVVVVAIAELPIACVEGWSTTQTWRGVRLGDLARLAKVSDPAQLEVRSLQPAGSFSKATLNAGQIANPDSLLALKVNGADLSLDHGYPARVIVPALPGVHCTKWVARLVFSEA
jgi:DMSO/TMAO reductase YedYZ molybdopterin-dependent catalytic subunit